MDNRKHIERRVQEKILEWGRGRVFFPSDFSDLDDDVSVRQALSSLTESGFISRLARGIYCMPRLTEGERPSPVLPDGETVAYALAAKENVRILPYGDQAARKLGLSSMAVSNLSYITDGSPRVISLSATRKIRFFHTSEVKMFAFRNEKMQLLSLAVRALGREYFDTPEKRRQIRNILKGVPVADFKADITLPPAWVADFLTDIWNN